MKAKLAVMSLGLFLWAGCSGALVGKWTVDKDSPDLKEAKTIIKSAQFTKEGDYRADIIEKGSGQPRMQTGKYEFNGFQLKLSTKEREMVWSALLIMNRKLELKRDGDKVTLIRVEE